MEIKEFVKATLRDVALGIRETNDSLKTKPEDSTRHFKMEWRKDKIEFDISVVATEESGREGGGGIAVSVLRVGGAVSTDSSQSTSSRIKFSVGINLDIE